MFQNSVNSRFPTIPYPWLVFGEKVKVNAVLIRDSTGVPDSSLILFGGALSTGVQVSSLIFISLNPYMSQIVNYRGTGSLESCVVSRWDILKCLTGTLISSWIQTWLIPT